MLYVGGYIDRVKKWGITQFFRSISSKIVPKMIKIKLVIKPAQKPNKKVCVNKSICKNK